MDKEGVEMGQRERGMEERRGMRRKGENYRFKRGERRKERMG